MPEVDDVILAAAFAVSVRGVRLASSGPLDVVTAGPLLTKGASDKLRARVCKSESGSVLSVHSFDRIAVSSSMRFRPPTEPNEDSLCVMSCEMEESGLLKLSLVSSLASSAPSLSKAEAMMGGMESSVAIVEARLLPPKGLPKSSNRGLGSAMIGVVSLRSSTGADDGCELSYCEVDGRISGLGPMLPAPNRRIRLMGLGLLFGGGGIFHGLKLVRPSKFSAEVILSPVKEVSLKMDSASDV